LVIKPIPDAVLTLRGRTLTNWRQSLLPKPTVAFLSSQERTKFLINLGSTPKNPTDLYLLLNLLIYSLRSNAVRSVVGSSLCKASPGLDAWQPDYNRLQNRLPLESSTLDFNNDLPNNQLDIERSAGA
jgi:hypothetical protein